MKKVRLNETYRLFFSASFSCIISVLNMSTKSSVCKISVLHSPSTKSCLIFILLLIVKKDSICFFLKNALHLPTVCYGNTGTR